MEYETKDSGERHNYLSGMVRDTQKGKPRFDLLWVEGLPYKDQPLYRLAMLMARGAEKYGDRNWENANSPEEAKRFDGSGLRHYAQAVSGETDEDHYAAVLFNVMAAMTLQARLPKVPQQPESVGSENTSAIKDQADTWATCSVDGRTLIVSDGCKSGTLDAREDAGSWFWDTANGCVWKSDGKEWRAVPWNQ